MSNIAELVGVPGLDSDLERVETQMRDALAPNNPLLAQVAAHLSSAGGKRLRPALTAACARAGGAEVTDRVIQGGLACELVHQGSLYHDDVMDGASLRHGVESANKRWGNLVAILSGDYLLARASEIAAGLGTEVAGLLAHTIGRMCEGQVRELGDAFNVERTEASYLASIEGKTATLWSAACRTGALVAGFEADRVEAFTRFGLAFGLAFQVRDDILDVVATDEALGKPAGNDLVEGVYTLPVLRALSDPQIGPELRELLGSPLGPPERDKAREMVRATDGVAAASETARGYADQADAALGGIAGESARALASCARRLMTDLNS